MRIARVERPACIVLVTSLALATAGAGQSQSKAGLADTMFASVAKVKPVVPIRAFPFSLKSVRLLAGPFKAAMDRDLGYMMSLENDRLLHMFRVTAGLAVDGRALRRLGEGRRRAPRPHRSATSFRRRR